MLLATVLKLWDAVAHFTLPTPAARHNKPPKEERDGLGMSSSSEIEFLEPSDVVQGFCKVFGMCSIFPRMLTYWPAAVQSRFRGLKMMPPGIICSHYNAQAVIPMH